MAGRLTIPQMVDWFLKQYVRERGVAPGGVVVTAWFVVPVSDLQARSVADIALFFDARDLALARGWIERGPRPGTFILTSAGHEAAIAAVQEVPLASAPETDQQTQTATPEKPSTKPEDEHLRRNLSGAARQQYRERRVSKPRNGRRAGRAILGSVR